MGLDKDHPEKEGVEVELASLIPEIQARLAKKQGGSVVTLAQQLQGVQV
jgi:histidyl-tRNA synthetase